MVKPGASPATYEPKPKQMAALSKTEIYFSIGAPFERAWLPKFSKLSPKMEITATDAGIKKRSVEKHVHHGEEGEEHHDEHGETHEEGEHHNHDHDAEHNDHDHDHGEHDHEGISDPHIWLDPMLVSKQADTITQALCAKDAENCAFFKTNNESFKKELRALDSTLREIFKNKNGMHFMVFHPSWGYFADRYGLEQIPVELEGKEPKPSDLKEFINTVKELGLNTIFIQPQFSRKAAELIASETGATVIAVDPLAKNWEENLIYTAKLISGSL